MSKSLRKPTVIQGQNVSEGILFAKRRLHNFWRRSTFVGVRTKLDIRPSYYEQGLGAIEVDEIEIKHSIRRLATTCGRQGIVTIKYTNAYVAHTMRGGSRNECWIKYMFFLFLRSPLDYLKKGDKIEAA